ncbi:MAG: DUF934 domain-containing protein [Gammaproteobacteria bacterium]|jgi:uncharacterized protein (DUF934 family)|nr:oxidoreductase [Chromatiales bacterium]MDP6674223.1 DUF934 domain-containing protein [Gammaproteobacteria bacterium]
MPLTNSHQNIIDPYIKIGPDDSLPAEGALLVTLAVWQDHWERLMRRQELIGVQLTSDEHPEIISDDIDQLDLIALEFPTFRDGRAYSYARLIRERYGFTGELRAVGDVLLEQLHYMERVGFNSFEVLSNDPATDFEIAANDFTVWYQTSGDQRRTATMLRQGKKNHG